MSTRKYLSRYEKVKKKRKTDKFLQSQVGAIEKHMLEQIDFNSLIIDFLSKNAYRINLQ